MEASSNPSMHSRDTRTRISAQSRRDIILARGSRRTRRRSHSRTVPTTSCKQRSPAWSGRAGKTQYCVLTCM